jgi:hypothetical protein
LEPVPAFDLYAELEVSTSATTPTIDAAWKSLMKRNHPDIGGPRASVRTVRLNIAHDWLADPVRRTRYDEALRARSDDARRNQGPGRVAPQDGSVPAQRTASGPGSARWFSPPQTRTKPRPPHATRAGGGRRGWRDRRLALMVTIGVLAVLGGFGIRMVSGGPSAVGGAGTPSKAGAPRPTDPAAGVAGAIVPSGPATTASPTVAMPSANATATQGQPPSSARPVITLAGAGDHGGVPVTLAGGRYEVSYTVASAVGESCPWALYLAGSNGLDLLMASAYPVDETLHAAESNSFIAAGKATVRVESGCPHWSASIKRVGP